MTNLTCDACGKTFVADGMPPGGKAACPACGNIKAVQDRPPGRSWVTPRPATWQTIAALVLMLAILYVWVVYAPHP